MAGKIEVQTSYAAQLYNIGIPQDYWYLAERGIFPCEDRDEYQFSPDFDASFRK